MTLTPALTTAVVIARGTARIGRSASRRADSSAAARTSAMNEADLSAWWRGGHVASSIASARSTGSAHASGAAAQRSRSRGMSASRTRVQNQLSACSSAPTAPALGAAADGSRPYHAPTAAARKSASAVPAAERSGAATNAARAAGTRLQRSGLTPSVRSSLFWCDAAMLATSPAYEPPIRPARRRAVRRGPSSSTKSFVTPPA
mmetsp:Transcript_18714/g.58367  ORF Transcript_18714/g.58367 Transcript_18714/m.58367 type:complete len:204 (-) Transcript_18714:305-916(-)